MKFYLFCLLFTLNILSAQEAKRFIYEYRVAFDSKKGDSTTVSYMNLDTDQTNSYFYNAGKFEIDSLFNATGKLGDISVIKRYNPRHNYEIRKDYPKSTVDYYTRFSGVTLWIPEQENITWNLTNDTRIIGSWNAQRATTRYKGRDWEAWFTSEIPLSDGPYKFAGLPGLIVQLHDLKNEHHFELIQIKSIQSPYKGLTETKNAKKITMKDYLEKAKSREFNIDNDVSSISVSSDRTLTISTKDGNHIRLDEKTMQKHKGKTTGLNEEVTKALRPLNNPIEL